MHLLFLNIPQPKINPHAKETHFEMAHFAPLQGLGPVFHLGKMEA